MSYSHGPNDPNNQEKKVTRAPMGEPPPPGDPPDGKDIDLSKETMGEQDERRREGLEEIRQRNSLRKTDLKQDRQAIENQKPQQEQQAEASAENKQKAEAAEQQAEQQKQSEQQQQQEQQAEQTKQQEESLATKAMFQNQENEEVERRNAEREKEDTKRQEEVKRQEEAQKKRENSGPSKER